MSISFPFEERSGLRYSFKTIGATEPWDVLIVAFEGEYGYGCQGNGDGIFIDAIMTLAKNLWPAQAVVADLRLFDYQWGDWVGTVFSGDRGVAVISDRCREGMTSFVRDEMGEAPDARLFDALEAAVDRVRTGPALPPVARTVEERTALKIGLEAVPLGERDRALLLRAEGTWSARESAVLVGWASAALLCAEFCAMIFDFRDLRVPASAGLSEVLALGRVPSEESDMLTGLFGSAWDGTPEAERTLALVSDASRAAIGPLMSASLLHEDLASAVRALSQAPPWRRS